MARDIDDILRMISSGPKPEGGSARSEQEQLAQSIIDNLVEARPETDPNNLQGENKSGGLLGAGLSVLGRATDLMSRPLYASANLADSLLNQENPLEEVWKGISGQDKTTYSDVLESAGVTNDLARGIGGLGLDIALDPTTYVGAGIVKQVSREAVEHAGALAAKELAETGTAKLLGETAAKEARLAAQGARQVGEKAPTKKLLKEIEEKAAKEAEETALYEANLAAKQKAVQEGAGKVHLKILGQNVGPGSEKLYNAGRGLADVVKETRVGNAFNKAFRPSSTFVSGTNVTRREIDSVGLNNASDFSRIFEHGGTIEEFNGTSRPIQALKDLTSDERKEVAYALDTLSRDSLKDPRLIQAYDDHKWTTERFHDLEAQAGIRDGDDFIDNYVHMHFSPSVKGNDADVIAAFEKGRNKEAKLLRKQDEAWEKSTRAKLKQQKKGEAYINTYIAKNRPKRVSSWGFDKAQEMGLTPEMDLANITGNRIQKHYRSYSQAKFAQALGGEFGVSGISDSLASKMGLVKSSSKYLDEGTYFPREIEKAIKKHDQFFFSTPEAGGELVKLYDDVLGGLKFLQTVVNPGHHIRNFFGDITTGALDGLVRFKPYDDAQRIVRAVGKDSVSLGSGVDLQHVLGDKAADISIDVGKTQMNAERLYHYFSKTGTKPGEITTEIVQGPSITRKIRQVSEQREEITRLAHFIHAFDDEAKLMRPSVRQGREWTYSAKQLDQAAKKASERVKKFKFDYGDLTPFEQRTMKRVIPFYTFMRKNIPMQVEMMFMRPGRQLATPKIISALQEALGEDEDIDILGLNALPDYMRQAMAVNLIGEGEGRNGVYWNPGNVSPFLGLDRYLGEGDSPGDVIGSMVEGQLSGLTPAAQIPLQQITGHNFFTGRPTDQSLVDQLVTLAPAGRYLSEVGDENNSESLDVLNWLTGAGITQVHPGMVQGELRRQEDIVQELLRRKREQDELSGGS